MSLLGVLQSGLDVRGHSGLDSDTRVPLSDGDGGYQPSLDDEVIAGYGERLAGLSEGRSLASDLSLHKIHSGLNTVGSIIRILTSVLSLFGADSIDRSHFYFLCKREDISTRLASFISSQLTDVWNPRCEPVSQSTSASVL